MLKGFGSCAGTGSLFSHEGIEEAQLSLLHLRETWGDPAPLQSLLSLKYIWIKGNALPLGAQLHPSGVCAGWIAAPEGMARNQGRDGKSTATKLGRPGLCQKLSL